MPVGPVVSKGCPQARGLQRHFRDRPVQECRIVSSLAVFFHRIHDVGVDMVLRRARGVIRAGLFPVYGAPGKERSLFRHDSCTVPSLLKNRIPVLEQFPRKLRLRVGKKRADIDLRIPKIVPLIPFSRNTLCRNAGLSTAAGGLKDVKKIEAQGLLHIGRSFHDHIGTIPKIRKKFSLFA